MILSSFVVVVVVAVAVVVFQEEAQQFYLKMDFFVNIFWISDKM